MTRPASWPTTPRWPPATSTFANGKFYKADEYYTDLRKAYPTSEHQFLAHFLGIKAKLNSYLGPAYGGTALDETEKLIKQTRRQFPQEAEKEREFLDRAAAEVRYRKAEQLDAPGRVLRPAGRVSGGRALLRRRSSASSTTRRWPSGPRSAIGQIAGLPPKPEQQLPWLVALFPESDKVKPLLEATQQAQAEAQSRGAAAAGRAAVRANAEFRLRIAEYADKCSFRYVTLPPHLQSCNPHSALSLITAADVCILHSPGCAGYQLGNRSLYRPDIRTVHVPMVQSDSYRRYLGERLTEAVVKEIELQTPYKVVDSDSADSVLSVRLVSDSKRVLAEQPLQRAAGHRDRLLHSGELDRSPRRPDHEPRGRARRAAARQYRPASQFCPRRGPIAHHRPARGDYSSSPSRSSGQMELAW